MAVLSQGGGGGYLGGGVSLGMEDFAGWSGVLLGVRLVWASGLYLLRRASRTLRCGWRTGRGGDRWVGNWFVRAGGLWKSVSAC